MLKSFGAIIIIAVSALLVTGCTGAQTGSIANQTGVLQVVAGDKLTIDLEDVQTLGITDFSLSLRSVSADYSTATMLYDLTSVLQAAAGATKFTFVIPRNIAGTYPMLVVVDIPSLNTQLIDVVYSGDSSSRPGIASTLTYSLLKFYPGQTLTQYQSTDYHGIVSLVQQKIDSMPGESDTSSLYTMNYLQIIRYFTNGLAFNPQFLTAIRPFGVNYTFTLATPPGVISSNTPENDPSLADYQYATAFKINGAPAAVPPFNQTNNPPTLMPGIAQPNPGSNLYTPEGATVSVAAEGFDEDDDYLDRSMIVQYVPRVLPIANQVGVPITSAVGFPFVPEPTPEYTTVPLSGPPTVVDHYTSEPIAYNEALDLNVYPTTLAYDTSLYSNSNQFNDPNNPSVDTAYRNVYYLISDGMVRIPYHWNFKYSDINRPPQIVTNDAQGDISNTTLDTVLAPGESELYPGTGWITHGSHCDTGRTDETTTYSYTDPGTGLLDYVYYQVIKTKADGPWNCVFRTTDPDIDADPNSAADTFYYSISMNDTSTNVNFLTNGGTSSQKIWPVYQGPPYLPGRFTGDLIPNCTTPDGKTHPRCGQAAYQVIIDNSVKAAADAKSSSNYSYGVVVYDRDAAVGGDSSSATLSREILIPANPARIINYSNVTPCPQVMPPTNPPTYTNCHDLSILTTYAPNPSEKVYSIEDIYLQEILNAANAGVTDLGTIGIGGANYTSRLAGDANRAAFLAGTSQASSPYLTEPFSIQGGTLTWNGDPNNPQATFAAPGSITLLGHTMLAADAATYSIPREYDSTCKLTTNNQNLAQNWSQTSSVTANSTSGTEGWTFEIDALDYDNLALNVGEASDPVHVLLATDVNTTLNSSGIQFCGYSPPNSDPAYYQTYSATNGSVAVNPDNCVWQSSPSVDMQPIPVYYTVTNNGVSTVKKWVYHRLRFKWQPKDQALTNGKKVPDLPFYIRNAITSMQMYGNRWALLQDPQDQTTLSFTGVGNVNLTSTFNNTVAPVAGSVLPINFYAQRKDMLPCMTGLLGASAGGASILEQLSPQVLGGFSIQDENKVLSSSPTTAGALSGRFEAELQLLGSRTITSTEFLKYVLYSQNCSVQDTTTPPTAGLPTTTLAEPLRWYTKTGDANNVPRVRFQSSTDPNSTVSQFCMNFNYSPLQNAGGVAYNEVILITNTNAATFKITDPILRNCTAVGAGGQLNVNSDQNQIAIASTCKLGFGHALPYTIPGWADPNSTAVIQYVLDPTTTGNGAYPSVNTIMNLDMFPSMYQADINPLFPVDVNGVPLAYNEANGIFFSASIFDTFRLDPIAGVPVYTGYTNGTYSDSTAIPMWLPNNSTNAIPASSPKPFVTPGFAYGMQVVDWDNQPNNIAITTPTPDGTGNIYFRKAPGDPTRIQVYVKNDATVSFPIQASDTTNGPPDLDAFDIMQYRLVPPTALPSATPSLVGTGSRADCVSAPAGYPTTLSTLNVTALYPYKNCNFTWTPHAPGSGLPGDNGSKYSYQIEVQDNYSATCGNGTLDCPGVGARHPAGAANINIPNDGLSQANGPTTLYNIDMEALEANTSPFFTTTLGGSTISAPYNTAGGAAGWTTAIPGGTAGQQPSCSASAQPSGFLCGAGNNGLTIQAGDTLQSTSPISMSEGSQFTFNIYAEDTNVTAALKTITATKPTQVLILDGPHVGEAYTVPSFATMQMGTSQNVPAGSAPGTASFSFSWTPTDGEANYLSNTGGFLIPVKITDQPYYPATDTGFPSTFVVQPIPTTVWIWAKLSVLNNQPTVFYLNGTTEVPLSGSTLSFQTGGAASFTIRVKDTDVARCTQGGDCTSTFLANTPYTGPTSPATGNPLITVTNTGTPYYSAPYMIQEFTITANPVSGDIGTYNSGLASIVDPGDPSLGLAINPDGSTPPKAQVFSASDAFTVPFNIQVIGKPIFQVPSVTNYQAYAYSTKNFYYPLSMFISRPSEKLQSFFMGIDESTSVTPIKTTPASLGLYVNEAYVLRWPDSSVSNITGGDRVVPIYGVLASYCNSAAAISSPAKTLVRYNEGSAQIETCKLSAADLSNNSSSANVTVTLVDKSTLQATAPPISTAEVDRTYAPTSAPSNFTLAIDEQFSSFYARCKECTGAVGSPNSTTGTEGPLTQNAAGSLTPYQFNAVSGSSGSATYVYSNYYSQFGYNDTSGFTTSKKYWDTAPSTTRSVNMVSGKDETLAFKATIGGTLASPYYQYRWYVNGCMEASGMLNSATIQYNLPVTDLMSGANNDCTGEYGFSETNAGGLGKLVVRLDIVNGTETLSPTSEGATTYYLWNVNVLNTDPNVISTGGYTPSNPVVLNSSYQSGNANIQFGMPVTYSNKNYFAYTDLNTTNGLLVHLREVNTNGDLPSSGSNLTLNCASSLNTQPQWIGFQPQTGGPLTVSTSINNTYPTGGTAGLIYGAASNTCFTNALTTTAPTQSYTVYNSSTTPAGYLAFSNYTMAVHPTASYSTTAAPYQAGANDSDFFLLDGSNSTSQATSQFWSYALGNIYSSTPIALSSSFVGNTIRKNIVTTANSGPALFQLIGAAANNANNWRGFILMESVAPNSNQLQATSLGSIMFSDGTGVAPAPVAADCQFNGTPLDGVYASATDTLYVFSSSTDTSGKGHLVAISHPTTSPKCRILGNVLNPSLNPNDHNSNISKMAFDSTNGIIYGIVNQGANLTSQFYVYDIYNQTLVTRDLSATLAAYELVFMPSVNAVYLFDNRNTSGNTPALYKIW
jgi:hypothetical protein